MRERAICTINSNLREIQRLAQALTSFCLRHHISNDVVTELGTALEEIVVNVIKHGYDDEGSHEITVLFRLEPPDLVVEVRDDGRAFNPLEIPAPDLDLPPEEKPIGGLGIHLAKNLTNSLEYRRESGINVLVMRKLAFAS